ncbi:MAG: AAA family ATPase [Gammaproteobacteria bacterium]|nr:AAA family ATPase [Gammaproteobacteria bacterium]
MSRGRSVYDHEFHEGVNIIRGLNGSGKSTISDFIFFALGGEFDDWKDAASRCDEVQAEVETSNGVISIKRLTQSKTAPVQVYFGSMSEASDKGIEGWENFSLRRSGTNNSFSQVLFELIGIPEAKGEGGSNITMHQILRLCYSDQRTPASRLFRFESFDTQNIREAVGGLLFGIGDFEIYETELQIRAQNKKLAEISTKLSGLQKAMPPEKALQSTQSLYSTISDLNTEKTQLMKDVSNIDNVVDHDDVKGFLRERKAALKSVSAARTKFQHAETTISRLEMDISEIERFQEHIDESVEKLSLTESALQLVGEIEFSHCPACGAELDLESGKDHCVVCKSPKDVENEKSRFSQIRLDFQLQARETRQIYSQNDAKLEEAKRDVRLYKNSYEKLYSEFQLKYVDSSGPRDAALAEMTSRIGFIDGETKHLTDYLNIAAELERAQLEKNTIQESLNGLVTRITALKKLTESRQRKAMANFSEVATSLLHSDFKRQEEFESAQKVELNFTNDAISVDGSVNFAESSNVFLKNTAILSILLASAKGRNFLHPRFLLLDNIEDKGMEMERSHLFQDLIIRRATEIESPFQIIYTTSMMNPKLELDDYIIGPAYTKELKTLDFKGVNDTNGIVA